MIWMQEFKTPNTDNSDNEQLDRLITGIAAGNRDCLAQLYDRTRAAVYSLALSYLKNRADAEDVTQDLFVQVWNCAARFQPQGHPMAWLMTMTRNMSLERLRRQSRLTYQEPEEWDAIPDDGPDGIRNSEHKVLLNGVLEHLTDPERNIVVLHAVAGLRHREIAHILQIPLSTELSRYHRALKKLKMMLEGDNTNDRS